MYSRCRTFKAVPCIWLSISTAVSRPFFPPRFMPMGERRASMICVALLRTTWMQSNWCMPRAVSVCRWTATIILWASLLWFTVNCKCKGQTVFCFSQKYFVPFAVTVPTTLPIEQRTRVGLLLFIRIRFSKTTFRQS
mgnify:CR=1 FL=1